MHTFGPRTLNVNRRLILCFSFLNSDELTQLKVTVRSPRQTSWSDVKVIRSKAGILLSLIASLAKVTSLKLGLLVQQNIWYVEVNSSRFRPRLIGQIISSDYIIIIYLPVCLAPSIAWNKKNRLIPKKGIISLIVAAEKGKYKWDWNVKMCRSFQRHTGLTRKGYHYRLLEWKVGS